MTISVTHDFESAKADGPDSTRVQPSHWNADHVLEMATSRVLGRVTASVGPVQELTPSDLATLLGLNFVGKTIAFNDTTAPTGWTKVTSHNDKALRVVSGSVGSGGSAAFSTVFGTTVTGGTAISQTHLPSVNFSHSLTAASHTHPFSATTGAESAHTHSYTRNTQLATAQSGPGEGNLLQATSTATTGAGSAHSHSVSGTTDGSGSLAVSGTVSSGGSNTAHTHPMDLRVQYVDIILATKDAYA